MSFDYSFEKNNPEIHPQMNDLIIFMIAGFLLGRQFQYRRAHQPKQKIQPYDKVAQFNNDKQVKLQKNKNQQTLEEKKIDIIDSDYRGDYLEEKMKKGEQENKKSISHQNQILFQKIKLQGKKLQEKGIFEMFFERKSGNPNFVRKIEKHEIISDYILTTNQSNGNQLVPVSSESILPDENSMLEISYYQNSKNCSIQSDLPKFEKKIVNLKQKSTYFSRSYLEHGRFRKLFRDGMKIGQGAFGTVLSAVNIIQNQQYAIKKVYIKLKQKKSFELQRIMGEIQILSSISHPNIVKYHTCWVQYASLQEDEIQSRNQLQSTLRKSTNNRTIKKSSIQLTQNYEVYIDSKQSGFSFEKMSEEEKVIKKVQSNELVIKQTKTDPIDMGMLPVMYIQMQLCENNLAFYLRKRKTIDRKLAFMIMDGLFQGVNFLHKKGILHRDLKPENIFLNKNKQLVKIGDFGLSIHVDSQGKNERVGTPQYIAPEIYAFKNEQMLEINPFLFDIFSLGVIYYELLTIFETAHERSEKLLKLKEGKVIGLNEFKEEKKLIKQMIKKHKRPSIQQLLQSKQFRQIKSILQILK